MEDRNDLARGRYLLAEEILEMFEGEEARLKKVRHTYKFVESTKGDEE